MLFGFWQADKRADASDVPKSRVQSAEVVSASLVEPRVAQRDAEPTRSVEQAEPTRVEPAEHGNEVKDEPLAPKDAQDVASANAPPGGSAVSDVLTDLEAAYRQRLIAAARAEAAARADMEPTPERAAPPEPPPEVAQQAAPPVAAPSPIPPPPIPVAAAAVAAPPPVEAAPPAPPAPAVVAQNDARPIDVHIGDVNQNTYITNVRQGDVYVIQQQLAMLNYMQLAGMGANPAITRVPHARGFVQQPSQSQFRQFPSTLTNLDNPWGFNFAPPNLVH